MQQKEGVTSCNQDATKSLAESFPGQCSLITKNLGSIRPSLRTKSAPLFGGLPKKYHPDLNVGREETSRGAFLRIQKAFETLSDPVRRAKYDSQIDTTNHWGSPPSANAVEIQPIHEFQIHPSSLEPAITLPPAPRRLDPELRKVFIFVGICIVLAVAIILIVACRRDCAGSAAQAEMVNLPPFTGLAGQRSSSYF